MFNLKSAFFSTLRLNISRTKEFTVKPMLLSYVGHFYTHLKNKLTKSLELFFLRGKTTLFFNIFNPINSCQITIFGQNWFHIVGSTFSVCVPTFFKICQANLENNFCYLKSAFLCNFEAKYQPNQRNYS